MLDNSDPTDISMSDVNSDYQVTRPKPPPAASTHDEDTANELNTLRKNVTDLSAANAKWENYTHELKNEHEQELASVAKDLKDAKQRRKDAEREIEDINRQAESRIKSEVEQKEKAVKLAIQQTSKIDELKIKLQKEKLKVEQLEEKKKYLEKAVDKLRSENTLLRGQPVPMDTTQSSPSLEKKLKEEQDENMVLKEQLKIFKADFDQERRDREKAQSDIADQQADVDKIKERLRRVEATLVLKEKENAALKEANRELQRKYDHVSHKLQKQSRPNYEGGKYDIHIHSKPEDTRQRKTPSPVRMPTDGLITEPQKKHIRSQWTSFVNYLRIDDVLPKLFSVGVISMTEKEEIESKMTSHHKNEYFLTHVILRGTQSDLRHFRSALIDSYQTHIADLLPLTTVQTTASRRPTATLLQEEPMDIHLEPWLCDTCTFRNKATANTCDICGSARLPMGHSETLMGRGVDQCDHSTRLHQPRLRPGADDIEEDM